MNRDYLNYFATSPKGLEHLLAFELKNLGALDIVEARAGVHFSGPLAMGYKACLHSRIANRVLLIIKKVNAEDADELYAEVKKIAWTDHVSAKNTLAVDFLRSSSRYGHNQNIIHTHFGALKVKDAIVDHVRDVSGARPSIDPVNPDVRVNVFLEGNKAVVSIDLSGESLHKRGYRQESVEAPLKENLAAAMLMLAEWHTREGYNLIDPMCGSGTILIEAGLMARNIAPGLLRKNYGFLNWRGHNEKMWQELQEEARAHIKRGRKNLPKIMGFDKDLRACEIASSNIEKADLSGLISCSVQDLSLLSPQGEQGLLVLNPPFGERLGDVERLKSLYKELGDIMKQRFKGWEAYILCSNPELMHSIGLKITRRFVLYNGTLECRLLKYQLY